MMSIEPSGKTLGAVIRGADLSKPLGRDEIGTVAATLAQHGVVCIAGQDFDAGGLRAFAAQLGTIQVPEGMCEPDLPEVSIVSNIVENGRHIGSVDAGMIWHKDMAYQRNMGWATVLYGIKIPRRDGRALGATRFVDARAAYRDLATDQKAKLANVFGIHDPLLYNTKVRAAGSKREAYSEDKIRRKPALPHPMVFNHPMTGKPVLYCDPNHILRIEGLADGESEEMVAFLCEHQLHMKYQWAHEWTEGDVLMWDNLSVLHCATLDYRPDELRLLKRCMIVSPHDFVVPLARERLGAAAGNA